MRTNIPIELRLLPQWVAAGPNKKPINPRTGGAAAVNDPSTWATYEEACRSGYPHVGFVLTQQDQYTIIDLDNKPEKPLTEEQWNRHQKILGAFDSYTERSTSGRGFHIIVKGSIPAGVHRDNVEVYSTGRHMICTGDVVRNTPIRDYQELLDVLYGEMKPAEIANLEETGDALEDREIVEMAMRAANADKFNALCSGDQTGYPSQSEADFALLSIFAFYTRSNEQCRRLFRMSALGKREKAVRNDTYLDFALGKIRAKQPPPIDLDQLVANAEKLKISNAEPDPHENHPSSSDIVGKQKTADRKYKSTHNDYPPGLIGELADYFYTSAVRPVKEIALAAAIAVTAGVCGRSYNVSGTGLNQYLILLAKTGSGKEGALSGIENLVSAVRPSVPMVDQFMGPAAFASGQALVKVLNDRPCFVSVLGEFGLTLQQLSDHRANSAQLMLRKVLLDLYAKSGWNRMLRSSVYSDTEKNTKIVQAPNVTILGESTPETFFDGLDASHVAEGLIPRFMVIEYSGDRPPRNKHANQPPNKDLVQRFADLVAISLTTSNNNTCIPVQISPEALLALDDFDSLADQIMNSANGEVDMQLWNRAHLKALKLAALLAVGNNPHQPIVDEAMATWAIGFVKRDVEQVAARFHKGDIGTGDSKQLNDLKRAIEAYFELSVDALDKYSCPSILQRQKFIPYRYLIKRTASLASYRQDRLGATQALKKTIQCMVESGMLIEVSKQVLFEKYKFSGVAYGVSNHWG